MKNKFYPLKAVQYVSLNRLIEEAFLQEQRILSGGTVKATEDAFDSQVDTDSKYSISFNQHGYSNVFHRRASNHCSQGCNTGAASVLCSADRIRIMELRKLKKS